MNSKIVNSLSIIFLFVAMSLVYNGCKKVDVVRIAYVKTGTPTNILSTSATANGEVIDLGEGEASDHGFCWSLVDDPNIDDPHASIGKASSTGTYSVVMTMLTQNKKYYFRSYIKDDNGYTYGNVNSFTTAISNGGSWLHWDDVPDDNGVGLTDGGSFDVAIRFPSQDLQDYLGYKVTRVKFIPRTGFPVEYSITLWEGTNPPTLIQGGDVNNIIVNEWNEIYLIDLYEIQAGTELWVGVWVQNQPAGEFPAGVDAGPAVEGVGNMISFDDGGTWDALSILNPDLNFNWSLRVYVVDDKGKEVVLVNDISEDRIKVTSAGRTEFQYQVQAKKQGNN